MRQSNSSILEGTLLFNTLLARFLSLQTAMFCPSLFSVVGNRLLQP